MDEELIPFSLTNDADGSETLAASADAAMTLAVTNRSPAAIELAAGASKLVLKLPGAFFTPGQMTAMKVTEAPAGWAGFAAANQTITFTCSKDGTWEQAQTLRFKIAPMRTDAAPQTLPVYLQPQVPARGDLPPYVPRSLTVTAPAGAELALPLAASLSGGGVIFRSSNASPLDNTLVLTLRNTSLAPISTASPAAGKPKVAISFVYGHSAGALAPAEWEANESPPADSAWRIMAEPAVALTKWTVANPAGKPPPAWKLTPAADNSELLGPASSDTGSFSVRFSKIRSFALPGHTQMVVLCTGFRQNERTRYKDLVITLDIDKVDPPQTRGLVAFHAVDPVLVATKPDVPLPLTFWWTMFGGVGKVILVTSAPTMPQWQRRYLEPELLTTDHAVIEVPPPARDEPLFATLQAYDANGTFLNQVQFTTTVRVMYVKVGHVTYPARRYGNTLWMAADYDYDTGASSSPYLGRPPKGPAGRLYEWRAANDNAPPDWELPTEADWQALIADPKWAAAPYPALIDGGASEFDAVLTGQYRPTSNPRYARQGDAGYYWTATQGVAMQFLSQPAPGVVVKDATPAAATTQMAVRYVRHL